MAAGSSRPERPTRSSATPRSSKPIWAWPTSRQAPPRPPRPVEGKDESVLTVDNLHAGYGTSEVLVGVSLEVKAGSVVALIGVNGAGKNTTVRAVCGMVRRDWGRVRLDGDAAQSLDASRSARLGL